MSSALGLGVFAPAILTLQVMPADAQQHQRREQQDSQTAYDAIGGAPAMSIFADIIRGHGLEEEFRASGQFGFFVPINAGMEKVPAAQIERIGRDRDFGQRLVLNHITDFALPISVFSTLPERFREREDLRTKAGNSVTLNAGDGPALIGGRTIIYTNLRVSNGLCHVIDGPLMI